MFESAKVIKDFVWADITGQKVRKEYGFGNKNHDKMESRKEVYSELQRFARRVVRSTNMDLTVLGSENLPQSGPVLYTATHKSVFDIVILASILEDPVIFIGKKEVKNMMYVNKWFDALGCIYLDREDKRQALQSILQGINEIKEGQSIVLFPEGTRSKNNEIGHFKEGGFKLATRTLIPVVPIALSNTYQIFEESGRVKKAKVVVNIGEPIPTNQLSKSELKQLPEMTENIVRALMQEIV